MKLGDFNLRDEANDTPALRALIDGFNATTTPYPRDSTVHAEFFARAAATPEAPALVGPGGPRTYAEVAAQAHRLAHLLRAHGLPPEGFVGVMMDDAFHLVTALLGILAAGGAYLPLERSLPPARLELMLRETRARALLGERRDIRMLNKLHWACPDLKVLLCPDSPDIQAESEGVGEFMREEIWDLVGDETFDDISGGGWRSSYTGELLSREVMDAYGESIRAKLAPRLRPTDRILEIGCASGISMFRLAPLVAAYHGTDLSARILAWTEREVARRGFTNISLQHLPAHELRRVPGRDYDVVILNSVLQCFSGHNYLRDVIRQAIDLVPTQGTLFLGNVWDQERQAEFETELAAYRLAHADTGARTKVDRSEDLFIARAFWRDLAAEWPEIVGLEFSALQGEAESELSRFGYDAILRIDKSQRPPFPPPTRHRHQLDARFLATQPTTPPPAAGGPASLAYAIYTSGTSGQPKGVLVPHRAILRLVLDTNYITLGPADRIFMTGSLAFDASTFEIWGALLNGGALCRPPERAVLDPVVIKTLIAAHGITTLWLTASLCHQLADADLTVFTGLRHLLAGGEKLSAPHINRIRAAHPDLTVINGYGPTENTTFTCCHVIDRDYLDAIPLGRPIANTSVYILDAHDQLVPVGAAGEICTGGDGLARGYLGDAPLTRAKFIPHPFSPDPAARLYRTGDLGRWTGDGLVEYLGRSDQQLKIRGYRIEPGEIETRLRLHPRVTDAAVVAHRLGDDGPTLVAYTTAPTAGASAGPEELRAHLAHTLPAFMVPAHFVALPRLPLTPNGKVDRRALPPPRAAAAASDRPRVPPANDIEREVLAHWQAVLDLRDLGVTDNFFTVGGHSLKVTKLAARLREHFQIALPLTALFKAATIRDQARCLLDAARFGTAGIDDPMVPLNPAASRGDRPACFLFPPGTGDALGYVQLAQFLADHAVYGFNFIAAPSRLRDYADLVESTPTDGPLILGGYSAGGNLAYHVALELARRGRPVAALILLDCARVIRPIEFPPGESERVAADFLEHESIRPYVSTPLLRAKAVALINAYYEHMSHTLDHETVEADIHHLVCEGAAEVVNAAGETIVQPHGWRELTRRSYHVHRARGSHNELLNAPHLAANAALLQSVIRRIAS